MKKKSDGLQVVVLEPGRAVKGNRGPKTQKKKHVKMLKKEKVKLPATPKYT